MCSLTQTFFFIIKQKKYNMQMQSKHLLPLASAYKKLKLHNESEILTRTLLTKLDTTTTMLQEQRQDIKNKTIRNKNYNTRIKQQLKQSQLSNKYKEIDKSKIASYSLLIKQSVENEDWENAIGNLKDMVDDDVYFSTKVQM